MKIIKIAVALLATAGVGNATAACGDLPNHAVLTAALTSALTTNNGGFNLPMWATIVDRDGNVCAVAKSGGAGEQWPRWATAWGRDC